MEALLMPPNKPYAFVIYKAIEESKKAYANLNGKEIIDDLGQKIILYSNYVEKGTLKLLTFFVWVFFLQSLHQLLFVCGRVVVCVCVCTHVYAGMYIHMYMLVCLLVLCLLGSKADAEREEPLLTAGKNVDSLK